MFLSSVNAEGFTKSKFYIADRLMEKVKEIAYQNIIQIITDNAQACKAGDAIMEGHYPRMVWSPCVLHTVF